MPSLAIRRLLTGVLKYRRTIKEKMVEQFEIIRDNPQPKAVFFTCMDSRMMATRFTQAQVGDMFMVRNAGNLIPRATSFGKNGQLGSEVSITTEPAAIELGCVRGGIRNVIVCGHSDCKAMNTLYDLHLGTTPFNPNSPLELWLRRTGTDSLEKLEQRLANGPSKSLTFVPNLPDYTFKAYIDQQNEWEVKDKLSQINCLQQLENISTHAVIRDHIQKDLLAFDAMWFDVYSGEVYFFSKTQEKFIKLDENSIDRLLTEL